MKQNRKIFEAEAIPIMKFEHMNVKKAVFDYVEEIEEIPWEEVKKDYFYIVFEENGTKVCGWVKATSDSYMNEDGFWVFNCELVEI